MEEHVRKESPVEYTVMTRMPEKAVRYADLTNSQREAYLFELGKTLCKIHSIDSKPFIESGLYPDIDKPSEIRERLKTRFYRVLGWYTDRYPDKLTKADKNFADNQVIEIIADIPDADTVTSLHSNPGTEHTFVTDSGVFSGLIDFGDSYISHPVCDFRSNTPRDRNFIYDGYASVKEPSDTFKKIWNAAYALDCLLDVIRNRR